jgi:hypothetical protein
MSIREELESKSKQPGIAAEVGGLAVYFRHFTNREYEEWIVQTTVRFKDGTNNIVGMASWFLVRALCDAEGTRLYKDSEQPSIAALDAAIVDGLISEAMKICIPRQIDEAEAEKNLPTVGSDSGLG